MKAQCDCGAARPEDGQRPEHGDLPGLLLGWLDATDVEFRTECKWRSMFHREFPPVERWLLRAASALRYVTGWWDVVFDEAVLALAPVRDRRGATAVVAVCRQQVDRDRRTRFFGGSWAPYGGYEAVEVPAGEACIRCRNPIREWQRGWLIPSLDLTRTEIWHANCHLEACTGKAWLNRRVRGGGLEPDQCPSCGAEWRPLHGGLISTSAGTNWRCHRCDHRWPAP